jgi:hypothetical protein
VSFLIAVGATLVASFALVPFGLVLARLFGLYVLEIQQLMWAAGLVVQVIPKGADILAQMSAVAGGRR